MAVTASHMLPVASPLVLEAGCSAHARRKFFELADDASAAPQEEPRRARRLIYPIALEAVQRIDALFDVERAINGKGISKFAT